MAFLRLCLFMVVVSCGLGCVSTERKQFYEQGYRTGVQQQLREMASGFGGPRFPPARWVPPVVQEVLVPAHQSNGLYIPEHKELIIVKPGEWVESPPAVQAPAKETYEPSHPYLDLDVADITQLPEAGGKPGHAQSGRKTANPAARMGTAAERNPVRSAF